MTWVKTSYAVRRVSLAQAGCKINTWGLIECLHNTCEVILRAKVVRAPHPVQVIYDAPARRLSIPRMVHITSASMERGAQSIPTNEVAQGRCRASVVGSTSILKCTETSGPTSLQLARKPRPHKARRPRRDRCEGKQREGSSENYAEKPRDLM